MPIIKSSPLTLTPIQGDDPSRLLREASAADFLGLSPRTLQAFRQKGTGPKFIAISRRAIRYRYSDLLLWTTAHLRTSTADQGSAV